MRELCSLESFVKHPYARKSPDEVSLVAALLEEKFLLIAHETDRNLS